MNLYLKPCSVSLHCKNCFGINSNYLSLKRSLTIVRNKADLESGIKTKKNNLALKSYLNICFIPGGRASFFTPISISESNILLRCLKCLE